jgi:hypothetical protein
MILNVAILASFPASDHTVITKDDDTLQTVSYTKQDSRKI